MKNDIRTLVTLLNDFSNSLDNRSPYFVYFFKEMLSKILDWNFRVWKLEWQSFDKNTEDRTYWFELSRILENAIRKIGQLAIKQKQFIFTVSFLAEFQKHVESHKKDRVAMKEKVRFYVFDIFRIFYQLLFEFVELADYADKNYMWDSFPEKWKITKENLVDKENPFARLSLHQFLDWAMNRILARPKSDFQLNNVAINLFPEVEASTWAMILIFVLSPYDPQNRIASILSMPRSFGYDFASAAFSFSEDYAKKVELKKLQDEARRQNAYELAVLIFPSFFTEKLLAEYIEEASKLKYDESSSEEHKRLELLRIFKGIQSFLQERDSHNPKE